MEAKLRSEWLPDIQIEDLKFNSQDRPRTVRPRTAKPRKNRHKTKRPRRRPTKGQTAQDVYDDQG